MLSGGGACPSHSNSVGSNWWQQQGGRRGLSVSAMLGGFKWPFGGGSDSADGKTRTRGCELAPKEAPEGLKLATFAGG